jgi:hypothetical protein
LASEADHIIPQDVAELQILQRDQNLPARFTGIYGEYKYQSPSKYIIFWAFAGKRIALSAIMMALAADSNNFLFAFLAISLVVSIQNLSITHNFRVLHIPV